MARTHLVFCTHHSSAPRIGGLTGHDARLTLDGVPCFRGELDDRWFRSRADLVEQLRDKCVQCCPIIVFETTGLDALNQSTKLGQPAFETFKGFAQDVRRGSQLARPRRSATSTNLQAIETIWFFGHANRPYEGAPAPSRRSTAQMGCSIQGHLAVMLTGTVVGLAPTHKRPHRHLSTRNQTGRRSRAPVSGEAKGALLP